jgi:deoxyribodipyrimidine photolyase-related protein
MPYAKIKENMKTLRLILGDQLNPCHSWFSTIDPNVVYIFLEIRQETDYVLHHAQKIIAIFASMRDFAKQLQTAGHHVQYLGIQDTSDSPSLTTHLSQVIQKNRLTHFEYQEPDEWRLNDQLEQFTQDLSISSKMVSSEHFFTQRSTAQDFFGERKKWLMESFYRQMRQQHQILMTPDQKPIGGTWNFDQANRKLWRGSPPEPIDQRPVHNHQKLWEEIQQQGIKSFGNPQSSQIRWPLNRTEALNSLNDFIQNRLPYFGDFQDAMTSKSWRLFHALISFALNTKMLSPREVVRAAEQAYDQNKAPIASVEGFIRQILGWREYIRGVYWAQMPNYSEQNFFNHQQPLPKWFWSGDTKMQCLHQAITASLEQAYAHHLQRLMVIGNFALLAGLNPQALHRWYLGIYIDAFEWVELPNTLGMSQFADGGLLASKPYVSSASYIHKMSDYCSSCFYDKKLRTGERACPMNSLYWNFFDQHRAQLANNPRIGMAYQHLNKMAPETLQEIKKHAQSTIKNMATI